MYPLISCRLEEFSIIHFLLSFMMAFYHSDECDEFFKNPMQKVFITAKAGDWYLCLLLGVFVFYLDRSVANLASLSVNAWS